MLRLRTLGLSGFSVSIGQGKPHVGLIAEMDALVVTNHFMASPSDGAAHACGHHLQSAIMAGVMKLLVYAKNRNSREGYVLLHCGGGICGFGCA
jgi:metal-dependent amidase/aminoacylase/carboxypeptidase family protein